MEEQFGSTKLDYGKDKKKSSANAAIGYNYETEEAIPESTKSTDASAASSTADDKVDDEDSDIDLGKIPFS